MVQPEDREDGAAVDIILKGKTANEKKIWRCRLPAEALPTAGRIRRSGSGVLGRLRQHRRTRRINGLRCICSAEEKIYIADDLPGGEESMIETVAHEWKHWLQYCNDEAYDEEEAEDFARQIVEEFL